MYSSKKTQKKARAAKGPNASKGKAKTSSDAGWSIAVKKVKSEDAGRYYFDSYKVGMANGKMKELGKYFCNCEELSRLINKSNLTKKENRVLLDMAKRYKVCFTFAHGGKCYTYQCKGKHTWFGEDKDAFRQAGCELKFCKKLCEFCKARPNVVNEFTRRREARKARRAGFSDTASTTGSTASTSSGSIKMRMPSNALYNPKALAMRAVALPKPKTFKAGEFTSLKSQAKAAPVEEPVKAALPKRTRKKRTQKKAAPITQEEFEPSKNSDQVLKLSELPETDLSRPIGAQVPPAETPAKAESTRSTAEVERNVYAYSEAPSEYDPNDYTSEISSQTSVATSVKQHAQMEERPIAEKAVPETSTDALEDTVIPEVPAMMQQMHAMMQQMMADMKILKAENTELKAQVSKFGTN